MPEPLISRRAFAARTAATIVAGVCAGDVLAANQKSVPPVSPEATNNEHTMKIGFHTDAFNSAFFNFEECLQWAQQNNVHYIECGLMDGVSWTHGLGLRSLERHSLHPCPLPLGIAPSASRRTTQRMQKVDRTPRKLGVRPNSTQDRPISWHASDKAIDVRRTTVLSFELTGEIMRGGESAFHADGGDASVGLLAKPSCSQLEPAQ